MTINPEVPFLDGKGELATPTVLAQIDARTKTTMRAEMPALADELGIGGDALPAGGTAGQVLTKTGTGEAWQTSPAEAAKADAQKALTTAAEAKTIAEDVAATTLEAVEPMDAQTAVLVSQDGTATRTAVSDAVRTTPGRSVAAEASRKLTGKRLAFILRHDDIQAAALAFLPLYREHGIRASWYVVANGMGGVGPGGARHATADDVKMLHAEGHEIGSHTMEHFYFRTGDETTEADRRAQLAGSKKVLEDLLGPGYTCETFAYPGNQSTNNGEVLDYYLLGTSGVPTTATVGVNTTAGTLDMAVHKAEYANPIRATSAEDMAAKLAALKAAVSGNRGVTVHTLQVHNPNELSVDEMRWLIEAVKADPELGFITMREYAHYMRQRGATMDGRTWFGPAYTGGTTLRMNTPTSAARGLTIDRQDKGVAYAAQVQGTTVATLDDRLVMSAAVTSRLEKGHSLAFYSPGNETNTKIDQDAANRINLRFSSSSPGAARVLGKIQAYAAGTAFEVTDPATQQAAVDVDATRKTLYVRSLAALPTGPARVGEMCVVGTKLYICVTAGDPGTWREVGQVTALASLQITQAGTSNLEQGHRLQMWSTGNTEYARLEHTTANRLQLTFKNAATGVMRVLGTLSAWTAGKALDLVNAASQLTIFDVDVDRRVAYLRPVDALPTDASRVGEMCIYQGALYLCTTAGASPVWTKVGGA